MESFRFSWIFWYLHNRDLMSCQHITSQNPGSRERLWGPANRELLSLPKGGLQSCCSLWQDFLSQLKTDALSAPSLSELLPFRGCEPWRSLTHLRNTQQESSLDILVRMSCCETLQYTTDTEVPGLWGSDDLSARCILYVSCHKSKHQCSGLL